MTTTIEAIERLEQEAKALRAAMPHGSSNEWADNNEAIAQRLRELDKPDCVWKKDEDGDFETQCGNYFHFDEGNINDNDCKFCQYCGGAVKES